MSTKNTNRLNRHQIIKLLQKVGCDFSRWPHRKLPGAGKRLFTDEDYAYVRSLGPEAESILNQATEMTNRNLGGPQPVILTTWGALQGSIFGPTLEENDWLSQVDVYSTIPWVDFADQRSAALTRFGYIVLPLIKEFNDASGRDRIKLFPAQFTGVAAFGVCSNAGQGSHEMNEAQDTLAAFLILLLKTVQISEILKEALGNSTLENRNKPPSIFR